MKFSHATWVFFSGAVWLAIGVLLLTKGLGYLVLASRFPESASALMNSLESLTGPGPQSALCLILAGLLAGFVKGRYVLARTVKRIVARIVSLPEPVALKDVYTMRYYFLIGGMMCLGMVFKWLPIGIDLKGLIDVAIGSALVNGAVLYFRHLLAIKKET